MPKGVINMTVLKNDADDQCTKCTELRFLVVNKAEKVTLSFSTAVDIRTEAYDETTMISKFDDTAFSPGLKHFIIIAKSDHVLIIAG